jgi:hypothetical protein
MEASARDRGVYDPDDVGAVSLQLNSGDVRFVSSRGHSPAVWEDQVRL